MTKNTKLLLVVGGAAALVYFMYRRFKKPPTVLIKGSDADTPENVQFSTASEGMLGSDGSLDKMIKLKKPIYIRPLNSIPDVYDRGIGQYVNASGCMNATGFKDDLNYNCNPGNVRKSQFSAQTDIPKLP
jgi:hypothetical protein